MESQTPVQPSEVPIVPEVAVSETSTTTEGAVEVSSVPEAAPAPEVSSAPEAAPAPELITSVPGMEPLVSTVAPVESGSVVPIEKVGIPVEATQEMIAAQAKKEQDALVAAAAAKSAANASAVAVEAPAVVSNPDLITEVPSFPTPEVPEV